MKKSDYLIIGIVTIGVLGYFLINFFVNQKKQSDIAYIYSGYGKEALVLTIDFKEKTVVINNYQELGYPIIDEVNNEILILSFYEKSGVRTTELIKYNFEEKYVQIIESECPNQICVKQGKSNFQPIICIPGKLRIEFSPSNSDVDVII